MFFVVSCCLLWFFVGFLLLMKAAVFGLDLSTQELCQIGKARNSKIIDGIVQGGNLVWQEVSLPTCALTLHYL